MPTYEFWYDETNTYKAWITADSLEQAKELVNKVQDGNLEMEDLPGFENRSKAYELLIDTVEEMGEI
jgi:hypothetical protein